ncbi:hypothetical protein, partial [Salinispora arenicola]|uniref:hypothetical protein n=1 Tax=Salinispora arenicola TaxID=168697 RepID=UPI000517838C
WPTRIWVGQLDIHALHQVATHADPRAATDLTGVHLGTLTHLEHAVSAALTLPPHQQWRHRIAIWPPGTHHGMTYSRAAVRALVIVASNPPTEHTESGMISLHDPRVGADNVALPGLPWGRATKIPPVAGGAVAFPGWVGASIAPLRGTHTMTVWTAEAALPR